MANRNLADDASNPNKATIVDDDRFPMADSASGTLKEVLWSLIKSMLKTYFDTIYGAPINYLINGGFDFAQRQVPGTLTTYSANTYSADRWKTYAENASYQYQRQDGLGETGLTSQYFGAFKKITNAGKMLHYQIVEGVNAVPLRGKTVIFQCQMKASSSKTIRMGIFELQNAGTIDTIPSPIVTAAGANSTDPTMGSNVAIITAAQSKSVTTSMQTFSVSVTVPSNSKNLICAVWTDSQFSANDILYLGEAGLYESSVVQTWKPRAAKVEADLCYRYCYVTPSGANTHGETGATGWAHSTSSTIFFLIFPVTMRVGASLSTAGGFRVDDGVTVTAVTTIALAGSAGVSYTDQVSFFNAGVSGTPLTQYRPYKLSGNNDTAAKLIFDAEL